jgi:hypothetical protein
MKIKAFASGLALFLLSLTITQQAAAQSASGSYQFSLEDGYTKFVEFDAKTQADGSATGQLTLTDEAKITVQDVDGTGKYEDTYPGFYLKADFDGLVVDKNQAVMSGTVRDSSVREFIGLRVLLTVEDNGTDIKNPDKLSWGLYAPTAGGWATADAEIKDDPGAGSRWVTRDAERKDDAEVVMPQGYSINTRTFPISSYTFADPQRVAGDILVRS